VGEKDGGLVLEWNRKNIFSFYCFGIERIQERFEMNFMGDLGWKNETRLKRNLRGI
jgi:hypothetical protein